MLASGGPPACLSVCLSACLSVCLSLMLSRAWRGAEGGHKHWGAAIPGSGGQAGGHPILFPAPPSLTGRPEGPQALRSLGASIPKV